MFADVLNEVLQGSEFQRTQSADSARFPQGGEVPPLHESYVFNAGLIACACLNGVDMHIAGSSTEVCACLCTKKDPLDWCDTKRTHWHTHTYTHT